MAQRCTALANRDSIGPGVSRALNPVAHNQNIPRITTIRGTASNKSNRVQNVLTMLLAPPIHAFRLR
jgi:hypothetical protein